MEYLVKKALQFFCEQSGVFPAKCTDLHKWKEFAENSPRSSVERVYRFWKLSADMDEKNAQRIDNILRHRLQCFEYPRLNTSFINTHKDKIVWVRSDWNTKNIFEFTDWEKCSAEYPFYVVDEHNNVRGIAIKKAFIFAGVLNFATTVDEAEYFYSKSALEPLTEKDVKVLEKNKGKVEKMMAAAGMPLINGEYLVVDAEVSSWRGVRLNKSLSLLPRRPTGKYFLLSKLN